MTTRPEDMTEEEYLEIFNRGYSDGFHNTDDHDANISHGNRDEIDAYHQGVEAGQAARESREPIEGL